MPPFRLLVLGLVLCGVAGVVSGANVDPNDVKLVHVIQSNHFDAGFADFVPRIMNRYIAGGEGTGAPPRPKNRTVYYPSFFFEAMKLSRELPPLGAEFKYMIQAWILSYVFDCTRDTFPAPDDVYNNTLHCLTPDQVADVKAGMLNGSLYMHAGPHNFQAELLDSESLVATLGMAKALAADLGLPAAPTTLSQRDVPGLTRGVLPVFEAAGVTGISVGVNDGTPPPLLPSTVDCYRDGKHVVRQPFVWMDKASGASVIADFHPGGYGGITGGIDPATHRPYYSRDGTLCDCVGISDVVTCYAWNGDNYGPPKSTNQTLVDFSLFAKAFPNATIKASSLDDAFADFAPHKSDMAVVSSEIGDTWMYGVPSDPEKVAKMRAMMRHYAACRAAKTCPDSVPLSRFKRNLVKLVEHTWGFCGCEHMDVSQPVDAWNATGLMDAITATPPSKFFSEAATSWDVQRAFIDVAMGALPPQDPLRLGLLDEFALLTAPVSTTSYSSIPSSKWTGVFALSSNVSVSFDPATGALTSLNLNGVEWASADKPGLRFMYRAHSYEEAQAYAQSYNYNHEGQYPYHEPIGPSHGGMNTTSTVSKQVFGTMVSMAGRPSDAHPGYDSLLVELQVPDEVRPSGLGYGAPSTVFVNVTADADGTLLAELVWEQKVPTRLPESIWLEVRPALSTSSGDSWKLDVKKIESWIDTADVVALGGAAFHGVSPSVGPVVRWTSSGSGNWLGVESLDAGAVAPGFNTNLWNFKVYDSTPAKATDGAAFCLFSNLYTTNYVLWYPWRVGDDAAALEQARSRFRFKFLSGSQ